MTPRIHNAPGPGLVARALPRAAVTVQDPTLQHALFRKPQRAIRIAANMCGAITWTIAVEIDGRTEIVPPQWVRDAAGDAVSYNPPSAVVIAFPAGGRRGGAQ